MDYLKAKSRRGADYIVTQLFFDNHVSYDFMTGALAGDQRADCRGHHAGDLDLGHEPHGGDGAGGTLPFPSGRSTGPTATCGGLSASTG